MIAVMVMVDGRFLVRKDDLTNAVTIAALMRVRRRDGDDAKLRHGKHQ